MRLSLFYVALSSLFVIQTMALFETVSDVNQKEMTMEVNTDIINHMMHIRNPKSDLQKQTDHSKETMETTVFEVVEEEAAATEGAVAAEEDALLRNGSLPPLDSVLAQESLDPNMPRPPILLVPGLVSSRLIAWKYKKCRGPDIQVQDIVWLNIAKVRLTMDTLNIYC